MRCMSPCSERCRQPASERCGRGVIVTMTKPRRTRQKEPQRFYHAAASIDRAVVLPVEHACRVRVAGPARAETRGVQQPRGDPERRCLRGRSPLAATCVLVVVVASSTLVTGLRRYVAASSIALAKRTSGATPRLGQRSARRSSRSSPHTARPSHPTSSTSCSCVRSNRSSKGCRRPEGRGRRVTSESPTARSKTALTGSNTGGRCGARTHGLLLVRHYHASAVLTGDNPASVPNGDERNAVVIVCAASPVHAV